MATKAEQLSLEGEKPVVFFVPCAHESVKTLLALDMEKRHNFEVHSLKSNYGGKINFQELEDLIRDKYKDYHIFIDELILDKGDSTILKKISNEVLIHPNQVFWVTITGENGVDATSELRNDFFIPELLNPLRNTSEIINYSFFERGKYILILSFKSNVICRNFYFSFIT